MNITSEPAFVLHKRLYRETSLLLEVFTLNFGRLSLVARGGRANKKTKNLFQAFMPLYIAAKGKGQLLSLITIEQRDKAAILTGKELFCALYVNELLYKLLAHNDAHAKLFVAYSEVLQNLGKSDTDIEISLRCFEKQLLAELGYALPLSVTADSRQELQPELYYQFAPQQGAIAASKTPGAGKQWYAGVELLAIANNDFASAKSAAKRLLRQAIQECLHGKEIVTKSCF